MARAPSPSSSKKALVNVGNLRLHHRRWGCAGLSLAYALSQSTLLAHQRILVVDRDLKDANDRTWCFWTDQPTRFDAIVHQQWQRLSFRDAAGSWPSDLGTLRYKMIRGIDFYRFIQQHLRQFPNIHFLQATIQNVDEDQESPFVLAGDTQYRAERVFSSIPDLTRPQRMMENYHFLWQHFRGWLIETPADRFEPAEAVLMDFRTPQKGSARFFYVLPLTPRQALVEYTLFSARLLKEQEYEEALRDYCRDKLGLENYRIVERESGRIPMTDAPLGRSAGSRITQIGTPGGAVKPSTGYAFLRIQEQVNHLVTQLERGEPPVLAAGRNHRFWFYDRLLLYILQHRGERAKGIFCRLFRHHSMRRILLFLNERSSWWDELQIFAQLPYGPFLQALFHLYIQPYFSNWRKPGATAAAKVSKP